MEDESEDDGAPARLPKRMHVYVGGANILTLNSLNEANLFDSAALIVAKSLGDDPWHVFESTTNGLEEHVVLNCRLVTHYRFEF